MDIKTKIFSNISFDVGHVYLQFKIYLAAIGYFVLKSRGYSLENPFNKPSNKA